MCYKRPGPRCSSSARELLLKAKQNEIKALQGDSEEPGYQERVFKMLDAVATAQSEYDATPAGQKDLQAQIKKGNDPLGVLALRLQAGIKTRKQLLAKIKAKDKGDLPHDESAGSEKPSNGVEVWTKKKANKAFIKSSKATNDIKNECGNAVLDSSYNSFSVFGGTGRLASTQFEKNVAIPALKESEASIIEKLNEKYADNGIEIVKFQFPGDDEADSRSLGDFYIVTKVDGKEIIEPVNIKYTAGKKPDNSGGIGSFSYALTGSTERVTKEQLSLLLSNKTIENAPPTDYHFLSFTHGIKKPTENFYSNSLLSEGGMIRRYNAAQSFPLQIQITAHGKTPSKQLDQVRKDWRKWYATGLSTEGEAKVKQAETLFGYEK